MRSYLEPQNLRNHRLVLILWEKSTPSKSPKGCVCWWYIMIWNCVELRLITVIDTPKKNIYWYWYCYNASSVGILPPKRFENSGIQVWFAQMLWGCSFVKLTLLDWPRWSCCWLLSTQITFWMAMWSFFLHPECLKTTARSRQVHEHFANDAFTDGILQYVQAINS